MYSYCKTNGTRDIMKTPLCNDPDCLSCNPVARLVKDLSLRFLYEEYKKSESFSEKFPELTGSWKEDKENFKKAFYEQQKTSGEEIGILKESYTQLEGQDAIEDM